MMKIRNRNKVGLDKLKSAINRNVMMTSDMNQIDPDDICDPRFFKMISAQDQTGVGYVSMIPNYLKSEHVDYYD